MKKNLIFAIVFFSFFFVACDGQEATLPDEEAVTDEVTDENSDEDVIENADEITDSTPMDEDTTETETDLDTDEGKPDEDSEPEIVYEKVQTQEDCLAGACVELCFLLWNEENGDKLNWHIIYSDGPSSQYITFYFETVNSDNSNCYVSLENDDIIASFEKRINATRLPIKSVTNQGPYYYFYDFISKYDSSRINWKYYSNCIVNDVDECEEYDLEKLQIEGIDGDVYLGRDEEFIPISQ